MTIRLGIIAEDDSDADVAEILIRKLSKKCFSTKRVRAGGCGMIRKNALRWALNLQKSGCNRLLVLHDLDTKEESALRSELEEKLNGCIIKSRAVVIPVREMESWLLADPRAIKLALNLKRDIPSVGNPEKILDPKREIKKLVDRVSKRERTYVHTLHNSKIALQCDVKKLNVCESFSFLHRFAIHQL